MADMMSIIAANYKTVGMTIPTKTPYVAVDPALYEGSWTGKYADQKTFKITVSNVTGFRAKVQYQSGGTSKFQEVQSNWSGPDSAMHNALIFNRRLWSIFMSAVEANENAQPMEVRQNIANIGVFVMKQTVDMQMNPDPAKLKSLIDINCNLAAGLSGRG